MSELSLVVYCTYVKAVFFKVDTSETLWSAKICQGSHETLIKNLGHFVCRGNYFYRFITIIILNCGYEVIFKHKCITFWQGNTSERNRCITTEHQKTATVASNLT